MAEALDSAIEAQRAWQAHERRTPVQLELVPYGELEDMEDDQKESTPCTH